MNDITIGVIAGTPVDTQMGIDFIKQKGIYAIGTPSSQSPEEQFVLQVLYKKELTEIFIEISHNLISKGAKGIFVNCNSLSAAVDLDYIRSKVSVKIVTPLDIYGNCAKKHNSLAVIAANAQSLSKIEQVIMNSNPKCLPCGAASPILVNYIENGYNPKKIYDDLKIENLINSLEAMNNEALILGCTHFPYIENEIKKNTNMKVINPSNDMLNLLLDEID